MRNSLLDVILNKTMLCFFLWFLSAEVIADESTAITAKRLSKDDQLMLESISTEKPKTIDASNLEKFDQYPPLKLNLRNDLNAFEHAEHDELNITLKSLSGRQLTISDIRAIALKNNLSLQIARINPEIAEQSVREEAAKFDRILFAYANYSNKNTPEISGDNVQFTSNNNLNKESVKITTLEQEKRELSLEAGVLVPLRTGGTIEISSPFNNVDSRGLVDDSDEYRSALRFSFSQPLLRNAGRSVNEASINIAGVNQSIEKLKARLQTIRIVAMIDKAYWELYQEWAILDVRRHQYEYANQNLDMVKLRVKEGLNARIEINRAEIGVAERLDEFVVADTNIKLAQRQLQFYLNDIDNQPIEENRIIPMTLPNLLKFEFDREQLFNDALENRIDLLEQELKLSADLIKIDYLENQTLPLFTLDYQYGALSNTESNINRSYGSVLDGDYRDWSIGVKFEMPFTNEARKARLDRAVQERMQRLTTKQLQTLSVKREIHDALDKVEQNWKRILLARQQVLIAGINYDAELKQFNEGLRTMTEVLETLSKLGEAQIKEIKAIVNYQVSLVDTAYATGTLLGYGNLEIN
jgi:outer membrane protein